MPTQFFSEEAMMSRTSTRNNRLGGISLICGIICSLLVAVSIAISGSPFEMIHKLNVSNILPPMWLWGFLSFVWGFLIGTAAGSVINGVILDKAHNERELRAYQGGLLFLAGLFFFVMHYPLFFVAERLFFALVTVLISLVCTCLCTLTWSRVSVYAAIVMASFAFWLFYVLFVTLSIIVQN